MSEQPNEVVLPPGYEMAKVTLENVAWVAERSGKDEQELRAMLMVKDMQGKDLMVKYRVVETVQTPRIEKHWLRRRKRKDKK